MSYSDVEDIDELTLKCELGLSKAKQIHCNKTHTNTIQLDLSPKSNKNVDFQKKKHKADTKIEKTEYERLISEQLESLQFLSTEHFAEIFVDDIIDLSIEVCERLINSTKTGDLGDQPVNKCLCACENICKNQPQSSELVSDENHQNDHNEVTVKMNPKVSISPSNLKTFSGWPSIKNFTINEGIMKISEYMDQWEFVEDWKYSVHYMTSYSDLVSDFHLYQGMWSIPTKEYPIAQATATVFFVIEVSRIKPKFCKVEVTMQFEGSNSVYQAGEFQFMEQWLFNIIDSKLNFFKTLRF